MRVFAFLSVSPCNRLLVGLLIPAFSTVAAYGSSFQSTLCKSTQINMLKARPADKERTLDTRSQPYALEYSCG